MEHPLKKIVAIIPGLYIPHRHGRDLVYYQLRHFDAEGRLKENPLPDLPLEAVPSERILQPGDVLLSAKGHVPFSFAYSEALHPGVASSSFWVLRPRHSHILPEFLSWYLNQPRMRTRLLRIQQATSMPSLSKNFLENLTLAIPSLEKQEKVLRIVRLAEKEAALSAQLLHARQKLYQHIQHQILSL